MSLSLHTTLNLKLRNKLPSLLTLCLLFCSSMLFSQLQLTPDQPDGSYSLGETANFVLTSSSSGTASYSIVYDNFAPPITSGTIAVTANVPVNIPYTHNEPGVVLCKLNLNGSNALAAAAFDVEDITPLGDAPADFDAFWNTAKAELATIDIDPQISDCETSTYETTCRVNLGNIDGRRVYGYISVPSTPGPYPAMLTLPPFGSGPNVCTPGDQNAVRGGVLSISINIHDVEPDVSDPNAYEPNVIDNPDSIYYKYAVLGAIRAIDYIFSRPDFNGTEMGVMGVSQGGGLSYLVAGIDDRVNLLLSSINALSEHNGLTENKASGFPYYINKSRDEFGTPEHEAATMEAISYYDGMHAATRYEGPTWTFIGYEDLVCPAATGIAAFNQLPGPKIMTHSIDVAHNTPAPYWNDRFEFFRRHYPAAANPPWPWIDGDTGYFINAGEDANIDITESANLTATVEYNETVNPNWPGEWKYISGPGTVVFSDAAAYANTATFSEAGTYVLQFTAYDYSDLVSNNRFTTVTDQVIIEVNDNNLPPEVTLSTANTTVDGPFDVVVSFSKNITGLEISDFNLSNNTITNLSGSGSDYLLTVNPTVEGTLSIQLPAATVTDNNGNPNNESNVLNLLYDIPQGLFLTCPTDFVIDALPGADTATANWSEPSATTTCSDPEIDIEQDTGPSNGSSFPIGVTTISYDAEDECDNEESCSFTVTVNETSVDLSISSCPTDSLVLVEEGETGAEVTWSLPTGSSNCYLGGTVSVTQSTGPSTGSFLPLGENLISYVLEDECGTNYTCSFTITIEESPGTVEITCPEDITIVLAEGEVAVPVTWNLPQTSSTCNNTITNPNCGTAPTGFSLLGTKDNHEYYISNNSATWPVAEANCQSLDGHLVTINSESENDFIDANVDVMVMIGLNDEASEGNLEWSSGEPLVYDNIQDDDPNTAEKDYAVFQFWNAKWDFINASVWKKYVLELDCATTPGVTLTKTAGPNLGDILTVGTYTVTYEAVDGCGDIATCSFTISVEEDAQTIAIDCPDNITIYEMPGANGAVVNFADATASTTCVNSTVVVNRISGLASGSVFPLGANTVTYEATDDCGSVNQCSFIINVLPTPEAVTPVPFTEFMGANTRIQYPNDRLWVVGSVRDYYSWILSEGYPAYTNGGESSPGYPNNRYKFNPAYQSQGFKELDEHYDEIAGQGLVLNTAMLRSIPHLADPDLLPTSSNRAAILEQKPIEFGADPLDPNSYLAHADWMYHFTARYGNNTFTSNRLNDIITPKLNLSETPFTGLGQLEFIENWNEPDKWWYYAGFPSTYFSAYEYAAMTSADYDGHMQTMSLIVDPDDANNVISTVGAKNADPNVKFVLAGLANLNLNYVDSMRIWFETNRTADAIHGLYPFDVLNFHHYSDVDTDGGRGVSPEQDYLRTRLETVTAYRDQYFPDKEVWLSEFGYDTDTTSTKRIPQYGFGDYDQREVQGQWLIRSFLEIAAAGIDRAHLYEFRDACTANTCGTFQSSGIVESAANDYKPKKSWYYVATLKHIMEDMQFDEDISPSCASSDTLCVTDCARVYRFANPDNPTEKVFAVWSPTSCGKAPFVYTLDLEGADAANFYELEVLSTNGKRTLVNGTSINIAVSERPVFIKVGNVVPPVTVPCLENLTVSLQTCSTINFAWEETPEVEKIQIWYQLGELNSFDDFDINTATLAVDNYDASNGSYLLTGLQVDTTYSFVIIATDTEGNSSDPCLLLSNTLDVTCTIPIDPSWIYDSNDPSNPPIELFDEQADFDPFCGNTAAPSSDFGENYVGTGPEFVSVDLQDYYALNAIALHDAAAIGLLTIDYALSPNGPWINLIDYQTNSFNAWVYLDNLLPPNTPLRYLRISASADNKAVINEMYICGAVVPFDDSTIPPGSPQDFVTSNASCNSIDLSWTAPFDNDILHYELTYSPNSTNDTLIILPTGSSYNNTLTDLNAETNYSFSIVTIDEDGNASDPSTANATTNDEASCNSDCDNTCPCFLCLNTAWITDLTPASGLDPTTLIDEQDDIDPFCSGGSTPQTEWGSNWNPSNGIPPMIAVLDLQECHNLTSIKLFDGNGIGDFRIEYKDLNDNWVLLENYSTSLWQEWYEIGNLNIDTRYLRFTKLDNSARIREIALCGQSLGLASCGQTVTDNDEDGYTTADGDCDDENPAINPGATELCDGIDNNCDGNIDEDATGGSTWYADTDNDGYGDADNTLVSCLQPIGYVADNNDCDDTNEAINPDATEICDDLDNDCNGTIDDDVVYLDYYPDADGDGYGDANSLPVSYCIAPQDSVTNNLDCDDSTPLVNPGLEEICADGLDNNCNGDTDEDAIPPTVTCTNFSVNLENGQATILPEDVFGSGSDNCNSITLVSVAPSTFTSADIGDNIVVLTVTDDSNNTSTCEATVNVSPGSTEYCESLATSPWVEYISRVELNTIDNSSFKEGYGDFTGVSTTVGLGLSYDLKVTPEFSWTYYNEYVRVWVDFNQDFDFNDPGELLLEEALPVGTPNYPPTASPLLNTTITIPATALTGSTRMRIAMKRDAFPDACEEFGTGEVEDYTLVITDQENLVAQDQEVLYLQAHKAERAANLEWIVNTTFKTDEFIVEYAADNFDFRPLSAVLNSDNSQLHRRFTFQHQEPVNGANFYRVRQLFRDGTERISELKEVNFDLDVNSFSLFPVPATNELFISWLEASGETADIHIYNSLGQQMYEEQGVVIVKDSHRVNLKDWTTGVYHLTIKLKDRKSITRRFVVIQE
ncbi:MAG: HYR domain-containing protein [Saprospiraceae bacterium]